MVRADARQSLTILSTPDRRVLLMLCAGFVGFFCVNRVLFCDRSRHKKNQDQHFHLQSIIE
jgi:hypothetical protein